VLRLQARWFYFASVVVWATNASAKDVKQSREDGAKFIGAVGCRPSTCHGGAGEKRSQYITWSRQDFHTRASSIGSLRR